MRMMKRWAIYLFLAGTAHAQVASNAPKDAPHALTPDQLTGNDQAIAPYVQMARESYPAARDRFLSGLPSGQHFFVVTRLVDAQGRREQVFILVKNVTEGKIAGVISSDIALVSGFRAGQPYTFQESQLIDWLITKPDGSEEGNVVGKFLDTRKP